MISPKQIGLIMQIMKKTGHTICNQQSNAIGALTELITNSIDAVLSRKAYESGINDLSGDEAPKSMHDAVRRFYKVSEGKLSSLETAQRTELAKKSILIGVKRKRKKIDHANNNYCGFWRRAGTGKNLRKHFSV